MKKLLFILFSILVSLNQVNAQIITTIAGIGTNSYSGEGGPATAASVVVHDVCTDRFGNIYITAREDNRVCKINAAGIITTVAGGGTVLGDGGPATAAQLNSPNCSHADNAGNIYISDGQHSRIRKVNTAGIITTFAGTGTPGFSGDGGPATDAMIYDPYGITTDDTGNIYFADSYNNRIRKINTSGIITTIAGSGPTSLAGGGFDGDGGAATAALLSDPVYVCLDNSGNILFTDDANNRVRKINDSGIITTIAGTGTGSFSGDSGAANTATLDAPFAVTVDGCGNTYIADLGNNRIRKINTSGIITSIAGISGLGGYSGDGGPATAAQLFGPGGICFDIAGNLLIADYYNNRLRMVDHIALSSGTITGTDSICHASTVTLTDTTPGGIWSSSNSTIATVSSSGIVTGWTPGADTITYTVTVSGCSVKTIFPFKVSEASVCRTETPVIPNAENETINIYPNPVSTGQFTVNVLSGKDEQVEIIVTNLLGEKVKEFVACTNKPSDISLAVPNGIYILSAATPNYRWNERILVSNQ